MAQLRLVGLGQSDGEAVPPPTGTTPFSTSLAAGTSPTKSGPCTLPTPRLTRFTPPSTCLWVWAPTSPAPHVLQVPCHIDSGGGRVERTVGLKHYSYEPSFAPPGKSVVRVMLVADYGWWKALRTADRAAYTAEKRRIGAEVAALVEAHYPEARGKVEVVDVATPTTFERYCNAWRGTWVAWATTLPAPASGRSARRTLFVFVAHALNAIYVVAHSWRFVIHKIACGSQVILKKLRDPQRL